MARAGKNSTGADKTGAGSTGNTGTEKSAAPAAAKSAAHAKAADAATPSKTPIGRIEPKKVPAHEVKHGQAAEEVKSNPKSFWMILLAFGIIILIIIGVVWYRAHTAASERKANQYNGFDFTPADGLWVARIQVGVQPYDIPFYYHPRDTLMVLVDPTAVEPLANAPKEVYVSVDPDAGSKVVIAGVEISRITGSKYNLLNLETHGALSRPPADTKVDLPVVNCTSANPDRVVIQFVQGKQDVIARSDKNPSCIILQYTDVNESVRVADRFAYMLLQIMH